MKPVKTIILWERGILGWESLLGGYDGFPNPSIAWANEHTLYQSQTLTYFTGPILAGLTRPWRAKQFAKLIKRYAGWRILSVNHSEGTATFLIAWKYAGYPMMDEVHLICGACNSDCDRNGINQAVKLGRVGKLVAYVAEKDAAMRLEDSYIGSLCFGLQCGGTPMGLDGPKKMSPETTRLMTVSRWENLGHSDFLLPHNFDSKMREILGNGQLQTSARIAKGAAVFATALGGIQKSGGAPGVTRPT